MNYFYYKNAILTFLHQTCVSVISYWIALSLYCWFYHVVHEFINPFSTMLQVPFYIDSTWAILKTYYGRIKILAIFAGPNFIFLFWDEFPRGLTPNWPKFVSNNSINRTPALVKIKAWWCADASLWPEPMMTQFTDAYMRQSAQMC